MLLEFGVLSRLLGDPVYESVARRSIKRLWQHRSNVTGLLGVYTSGYDLCFVISSEYECISLINIVALSICNYMVYTNY